MVHARDCVGTDGTVLFNGVGDGDEGAEKHLVHLSQVADCCKADRNQQNKHLVCNKDDDVDDGADDGDDDSAGNGDDDGVDNGADGADKHLVHLSQVADCYRMDRHQQNKHLVCNEDDDVDDGADDGADDGDDDSAGNGDDNGVDDGADSAEKHLVHLSQVADCCLADRNQQNEHLVCNDKDDVDN
eukprot:12672895-Ditylum_brightwellii.AAC.1